MGKASQMEVCVSEKGYEQLLASGKMPEDCGLRRGQSEASLNAKAMFMWDPGLLPDLWEATHSQSGQ